VAEPCVHPTIEKRVVHVVILTVVTSQHVGIGLTFDVRNPPPWRRPWSEVYARTLERIEEAERLGLASTWLTEHHLLEDGYLPQPLTFSAAIAARTRTIRVGTGILIAPLRKPIDIAEQAAVVDILSGGRLELGLGAGYAADEFAAYGVEHATRHRLLRQTARELPKLWRELVTPPPVQSLPPLWIGALGPRLGRFAGTIGAGLLSVNAELLAAYEEGLRAGGHDPNSARCAGRANLILVDDPEAAWPRLAPHVKWIVESYGRISRRGGTAAQANVWPEEVDVESLRCRTGVPVSPTIDVVTPAEALERLRPFAAERPLAHLLFVGDLAGAPDDLLDRHVELLGAHLVGAL
jgi:alkanesulfonate monooxygenase SsuD/methylene tetrahydromethanopterin reductase-like flavin-dependent oxidoreductase (luciferase family)